MASWLDYHSSKSLRFSRGESEVGRDTLVQFHAVPQIPLLSLLLSSASTY